MHHIYTLYIRRYELLCTIFFFPIFFYMVEEVLCRLKRFFSDQKLENLSQISTAIHVQRILGAFQQLFIVSQNFSFIRVKKKI